MPEFVADVGRISQVFYNILVNAIRYSPTKSILKVATVQAQIEGQLWIKVSVADNGPGIGQEDIPHIFGHFYRGDKSRNRKNGGSGLGFSALRL